MTEIDEFSICLSLLKEYFHQVYNNILNIICQFSKRTIKKSFAISRFSSRKLHVNLFIILHCQFNMSLKYFEWRFKR